MCSRLQSAARSRQWLTRTRHCYSIVLFVRERVSTDDADGFGYRYDEFCSPAARQRGQPMTGLQCRLLYDTGYIGLAGCYSGARRALHLIWVVVEDAPIVARLF